MTARGLTLVALTALALGCSKAPRDGEGPWIAEAGYGASPVGLILVGAPLGLADSLAVRTKTSAALAGDDGFLDLKQRNRERLCGCTCHCIP